MPSVAPNPLNQLRDFLLMEEGRIVPDQHRLWLALVDDPDRELSTAQRHSLTELSSYLSHPNVQIRFSDASQVLSILQLASTSATTLSQALVHQTARFSGSGVEINPYLISRADIQTILERLKSESHEELAMSEREKAFTYLSRNLSVLLDLELITRKDIDSLVNRVVSAATLHGNKDHLFQFFHDQLPLLIERRLFTRRHVEVVIHKLHHLPGSHSNHLAVEKCHALRFLQENITLLAGHGLLEGVIDAAHACLLNFSYPALDATVVGFLKITFPTLIDSGLFRPSHVTAGLNRLHDGMRPAHIARGQEVSFTAVIKAHFPLLIGQNLFTVAHVNQLVSFLTESQEEGFDGRWKSSCDFLVSMMPVLIQLNLWNRDHIQILIEAISARPLPLMVEDGSEDGHLEEVDARAKARKICFKVLSLCFPLLVRDNYIRKSDVTTCLEALAWAPELKKVLVDFIGEHLDLLTGGQLLNPHATGLIAISLPHFFMERWEDFRHRGLIQKETLLAAITHSAFSEPVKERLKAPDYDPTLASEAFFWKILLEFHQMTTDRAILHGTEKNILSELEGDLLLSGQLNAEQTLHYLQKHYARLIGFKAGRGGMDEFLARFDRYRSEKLIGPDMFEAFLMEVVPAELAFRTDLIQALLPLADNLAWISSPKNWKRLEKNLNLDDIWPPLDKMLQENLASYPDEDSHSNGGIHILRMLQRFVRRQLMPTTRLWKEASESDQPDAYLDNVLERIGEYARGKDLFLDASEIEMEMAFLSLRSFKELSFENFKKTIRTGQNLPPPFLEISFSAAIPTVQSVHVKIDKGELSRIRNHFLSTTQEDKINNYWDTIAGGKVAGLKAVKSLLNQSFVEKGQWVTPRQWPEFTKRCLYFLGQMATDSRRKETSNAEIGKLILWMASFLALPQISDYHIEVISQLDESDEVTSEMLARAIRIFSEFYLDSISKVLAEAKFADTQEEVKRKKSSRKSLQGDSLSMLRKVRDAIDKMVKKIDQEAGKAVDVEFVTTKTATDQLNGYVGQDCTKEKWKTALRHKDLEIVRMISEKKLVGMLYLKEAFLNGKKCLVLGIQPRNDWNVDHQSLFDVIEKNMGRIALEKGYDYILIAHDMYQQSNRVDMLQAIRARAKKYELIHFNHGVEDEIFEGENAFLVMWDRKSSNTPDGQGTPLTPSGISYENNSPLLQSGEIPSAPTRTGGPRASLGYFAAETSVEKIHPQAKPAGTILTPTLLRQRLVQFLLKNKSPELLAQVRSSSDQRLWQQRHRILLGLRRQSLAQIQSTLAPTISGTQGLGSGWTLMGPQSGLRSGSFRSILVR